MEEWSTSIFAVLSETPDVLSAEQMMRQDEDFRPPASAESPGFKTLARRRWHPPSWRNNSLQQADGGPLNQHASHAGRHEAGQRAAQHGAQAEPRQIGSPPGRYGADAAELHADRAEIREAAQRIRH